MEKMNELVEALYPQYGAPGSRDVDISARRKAIDESAAVIAEAFRALERERNDYRNKFLDTEQRAEAAEAASAKWKEEAIKAHEESEIILAKLAELEKQEPYAYAYRFKGRQGLSFRKLDIDKCDSRIMPLFTRPAPAVNLAELVPEQVSIRQAIAALENHEYCTTPASGYKAGVKDTVAAILRNIEEAK